MPQVASIVLANGETTPINHTFAPIGQDAKTGVWWFEDQNPRIAVTSTLGWPRIGISTKRENEVVAGMSSKNQITRVEYTIAMPVLESIGTSSSGFTPAPQIAYVDRFKGIMMISARDTIADRKDLRLYARNIHSNATFVELVDNLQSIY